SWYSQTGTNYMDMRVARQVMVPATLSLHLARCLAGGCLLWLALLYAMPASAALLLDSSTPAHPDAHTHARWLCGPADTLPSPETLLPHPDRLDWTPVGNGAPNHGFTTDHC